MHTASKLSLAVVALLAIGTTTVQAQTANINATATVQTPLTLSGQADLAFAAVFPGVAKTVLSTDPGAGRFLIAGQAAAEVNVTFSLPTQLTSGANNLPIGTFTGGQFATNTQASQTALVPTAPTVTNIGAGGNLFIWLGGTVTPAFGQAAGAYTAPITMTVAYTGN